MFHLNIDLLLRTHQDWATEISNPYALPIRAFCTSIRSLVHTTSAPFLLASASVHQSHFQRFSIAESIRAGNISAEPGESEEVLKSRRKRIAHANALAKMTKFNSSGEGIDAMTHDVATTLLSSLSDGPFHEIAPELLMQGTVGIWSALEVFIRDEIRNLLNQNPAIAAKLQSDPLAKRRFELPRLTLADLESNGFDLSKRMGDIILGDRDLSDLCSLKTICNALFVSSELHEQLSNPRLWRLNQDRHLIVHRRGIVDEVYLRNTGATFSINDQLPLVPDDVERYFETTTSVATVFLGALKKEI